MIMVHLNNSVVSNYHDSLKIVKPAVEVSRILGHSVVRALNVSNVRSGRLVKFSRKMF